ncbi:MAG TPA: ribonuclease E inhibitor RraB [Opitutaceae bacterium]|jgi:hypothetical protein|nr:ribonuclease E inhibitor RraB [Opitutaceae bacterium]
MNLFGLFPSKPKRYVSDASFRTTLARQISMAPMTMVQLRKHGVSNDSLLKLEFFFYTNDAAKAASLSAKLNASGYSAKCEPSSHNSNIQIVNGWTGKMEMSDAVVTVWTRDMCDLGFSDDCEFDGWGTNPKQAP